MEYILFVFYLLIACWLITKISFVKNSGLGNNYILVLFLIKVMAGLAIGWISLHVYGSGNDYWNANTDGWKQYQLLWSDPKEYFTNIFHSQYERGYGGVFDSFQSFWNDLRNNIISKVLSIFDIFTRGNYYVNSLFFNFFGFLGHVAFYRIFIQLYKNKWPVIACCFLLPSMLYFTSGVQKDSIIFTVLGFLCYVIFNSLQLKNFNKSRIVIIAVCFAVLFLIRSYVLINILPALTIWILVATYNWRPLKSFIIGYTILGMLFFLTGTFIPSINPLQTVADKQAAFFTLPRAVTQIETDTLHPHFKSFIQNAPQALNHLLLRPYPTEVPVKSQLPINIELIIYQLLFVVFLFIRSKKEQGHDDPFIVFGLFFTITMFLFIGYIMPNLGSIIRYRSIYLPFLLSPIICRIDWIKIARLVKLKNK